MLRNERRTSDATVYKIGHVPVFIILHFHRWLDLNSMSSKIDNGINCDVKKLWRARCLIFSSSGMNRLTSFEVLNNVLSKRFVVSEKSFIIRER